MHLMTMRLLASADSVCSSLIVDGKQLGYNVGLINYVFE